MSRIQAERRAAQLNESFIGPGPYIHKHSAIEAAWYVAEIKDGKEFRRIYR